MQGWMWLVHVLEMVLIGPILVENKSTWPLSFDAVLPVACKEGSSRPLTTRGQQGLSELRRHSAFCWCDGLIVSNIEVPFLCEWVSCWNSFRISVSGQSDLKISVNVIWELLNLRRFHSKNDQERGCGKQSSCYLMLLLKREEYFFFAMSTLTTSQTR